MQVVVSMYLASTGSSRMPVFWHRSEAEERRISSVAALMVAARYAFASLTRKALYSGVHVLGSMADGVRRLASGPVWLGAPANPQWIGNPICQVGRPLIWSGRKRLVTMAT